MRRAMSESLNPNNCTTIDRNANGANAISRATASGNTR
jgi:hypothetical protein